MQKSKKSTCLISHGGKLRHSEQSDMVIVREKGAVTSTDESEQVTLKLQLESQQN